MKSSTKSISNEIVALSENVETDSLVKEEENLALSSNEKINQDIRQEYEQYAHISNDEKYKRLDILLEKAGAYSNFLCSNMPSVSMCPISQVDDEQKEKENISNTKGTKRKHQSKTKNEKVDVDETNNPIFEQPQLVTGGKLRPYQLEGVRWLCNLFENGLNGILADEMGLGKTLQIISLFAHLRGLQVPGPYLIVAPLSTLPNWVNEFKKFTPDMDSLLYHGNCEERKELRKRRMPIKNQFTRKFPIIVTSYEIVIRDRAVLQKYNWKYIVIDEGHRLKNMNCLLIRELKKIQSENRLLLTGTPLQNNLSELWSLLNYILPDVFDDLKMFETWFAFDDIEVAKGNANIVKFQKSDQIISKLHEILRPFFLRRLKVNVVKDVPPKLEIVVYCGKSQIQRYFYDMILKKEFEAFMIKKYGPKYQHGRFVTLRNQIMQLRKCCNHTYLFDEDVDSSGNLSTNENIIQFSGKMVLLDKMLKRLRKDGHKVLIFSQMTRMLDIIEDYCNYSEYTYCRLDGSTSWQDRDRQMKEFNSNKDMFLFLLSTRAGGLGINLVAADTVIIYDSDWNPHQDNQAQDRCHRIGQTKPVAIYRLITENSAENRMLERANTKKKLDRIVIQRGDFKEVGRNSNKSLTVVELKQLLEDDVNIRHGVEIGGIQDDELELILNRKTLFSSNKLDTIGKGYEIVDIPVSSFGSLD